MTEAPVWVVGRLRAAGCIFAEDEAALLADAANDSAELSAFVERRAGGEPIEYVVGWAEFCGLRVHVAPGVFVPRPRTELLAEEAVRAARNVHGRVPVVLDLCCGSGAIAAVVAARVPGVELHASDVDPAATRCSARNLTGRGAHVYTGDLYEALPHDLAGRVDVLVANVPYVPTDEIELLPSEAREHEPHVALDGGTDGLDLFRRVVAGAPRWLAPGGVAMSEVAAHQVDAATRAVERAGLAPRHIHDDDLGATVILEVMESVTKH